MKTVKEILTSIRPEAGFENSADFIADSLLDSLDIIRLVSELDSNFSISIDGNDILPDNFQNLSALEALVGKYRKTGSE